MIFFCTKKEQMYQIIVFLNSKQQFCGYLLQESEKLENFLSKWNRKLKQERWTRPNNLGAWSWLVDTKPLSSPTTDTWEQIPLPINWKNPEERRKGREGGEKGIFNASFLQAE